MDLSPLTLEPLWQPCPVCGDLPPSDAVCVNCGGTRGKVIGWRTPCTRCNHEGTITVEAGDVLSGAKSWVVETCPECEGRSAKVWSVHVLDQTGDDTFRVVDQMPTV